MADFSSKIGFYSTIALFFCFQNQIYGQSVQFVQSESWEQVQNKAASQNKVIFVDVYTDWCAPCKMMDKDVFADKGVSTFFNANFINYKVNAEKEGINFARQYAVGSYPTLLFINPAGEVLHQQIGALSKFDLLDKAAEVRTFHESDDLLSNINSDRPDQYSLDEIESILQSTKNFPFDNKMAFAKRYLFEKTPISDLTLELTMDQIENFDHETLVKIAPMIGGFLPSVVAHDRIGRQKINWRNQMKTMMDRRIQSSIRDNDFIKFERAVQLHISLGDIYERDVARFYYLFYRSNDWDKFAQHAEYMMTKFVLSAPIDKVRLEDERRYKLLREMDTQQRSNVSEFVSENNQIATTTPLLDSIANIYNISQSIADQLFEVSGDFYAFYEDELMWRKAERWAAAAVEYFPYDLKYYGNHIFLLQSLGQNEKAQLVENRSKQLTYYQEMLIQQRQRQQGLFMPE